MIEDDPEIDVQPASRRGNDRMTQTGLDRYGGVALHLFVLGIVVVAE